MKFLLFDTETTGLPQVKTVSPETIGLWPHIVQFSYLVYDTDIHQITEIADDIICLPKNMVIQKEAVDLHGITSEMSQEKGVDIQTIFRDFFHTLSTVDILVGHNIAFDINMVRVELLRIMQDPQNANEFATYYSTLVTHKNIYCTMQETIELCNIIAYNSRGPYVKYPKLVELYVNLFGMPPKEPLHNSLHDILATLRCFLKLRFQHEKEEENMEDIKQHLRMMNSIKRLTQCLLDCNI